MKKFLTAALASASILVVSPVSEAVANTSTKVTICHRTHSVTNPYVRITVSQNSLGSGNGKHGGASHDQYSSVLFPSGKPVPNVFNPAVTYSPASEKKWGDIIPYVDVSGTPLTNSAATVAGLNYSGLGIAIYNGTSVYAGLCKNMTPRELYDSEVAAGKSPADVLADMDETEADEWVSAKTNCGGTFVGCSPSTIGSPGSASTSKVTICHRTHSVTNPYVRITVSQNSLGSGNGKHGGASHDQYSSVLFPSGKPVPNVFNPAVTYSPASEKKWGDIIPLVDVNGSPLTNSAATVAGLNYSGIGMSIYNGTGVHAGLCKRMSARELYDSEVSAGKAPVDVLADMEETEADEWASVRTSCGGTFVGCSPSVIGVPAPSVPNYRKLKGMLWLDVNRNGLFNFGERIVANYPVLIQPAPGNSTASTFTAVTGPDGSYELMGIPAGRWIVRPAALPNSNYEYVFDSDSGLSQVDWSVVIVMPTLGEATASFGAAMTNRAISLRVVDTLGSAPSTQTVRGTVWIDANRDGVRGSTERVIVNHLVEIVPGAGNPSTLSFTATTDATGYYELFGLPAGTWIVRAAGLSRLNYDRVYDSDSGTSQVDWMAEIMVPVGGEGFANFGAALNAASIAAGITDDIGAVPAEVTSALAPSLPATGSGTVRTISLLALSVLLAGLAMLRRGRHAGA